MSLKYASQHSAPLPTLPNRIHQAYPCDQLQEWLGLSFWLEPNDDRLMPIHLGEPSPTPQLDNLEGMVRYWTEHPEWMDFLDPNSPTHADKMLERTLYLDFWKTHLHNAQRVLDVGGGVGRLGHLLLEQGAEVQVVDPDLRSLWRNLSHAIGTKGTIDLHWSTAERLPQLGLFDTVLACEVLNYVEDPDLVVHNIHRSMHPGGILLLSVEARWGWAMGRDVAGGTLESFLDGHPIHVPNDRWIRTYTEQNLRDLLSDFTILDLQRSHYTLSGPFEWSMGEVDSATLLQTEHALRNHPVSQPLNRAWMVIAQRS